MAPGTFGFMVSLYVETIEPFEKWAMIGGVTVYLLNGLYTEYELP